MFFGICLLACLYRLLCKGDASYLLKWLLQILSGLRSFKIVLSRGVTRSVKSLRHTHTRTNTRIRGWAGSVGSIPTQIRGLAGGLGQPPLPAQVLARIPRGGTVGGGALQHEVLAPGGADDPRRQEHVNDRLQEQLYLGLLQPWAVYGGSVRKTEAERKASHELGFAHQTQKSLALFPVPN